MREVLVSLLQQRMDKCTTEQFWAVAALTGLNGFLIVQRREVNALMPSPLVLGAIWTATVYGCYFVMLRHRHYYRCRADQAKLLESEADAPAFLRSAPSMRKTSSLVGVVFYSAWMIASAILGTFAAVSRS